MSDLTTYDYDIFLSHNHNDQEWTTKLAERLEKETWQGRTIKVFFSPWDIRPGQSIPKAIEKGLEKSRKIALIMSPDAMESAWVELERLVTTHIAISARDERLIPLHLHDCEIPTLLRPILSVDFRDDANFENAYEMLISVIKDEPLPRRSLMAAAKAAVLPPLIPRPPIVGFVARRDGEGRDIVQRLRDELAPRKNQLIVLSGPGGVGKTTLAAETVREMGDVFGQRVLWVSALGREDFSLTTLLDEVATQLGHADLGPLVIEAKTTAVQALIASAATLVILDNFETIGKAEQTRCIEYVLNRAPCPVLITTRQRIDTARNVVIPVMSHDEASDFVQRLVEQTSDPSAFTAVDLPRIMQTAERNPLIMQWVVAQINLAQEANTVLSELANGVGDAAQRVFDRSFGLQQLGDDGRTVLLALSLFVPDASRDALAHVVGFGTDLSRLNEAVKQLASLWLLKTKPGGSRLIVEGLTRELAKARLIQNEGAPQIRVSFIEHFLAYASAHSQPTLEDYDALEAERDNVSAAIDIAFQIEDWNSVQQLVSKIYDEPHGFLLLRGYWDEAIMRNEQASLAARNAGHEWAEMVFASQVATVRMKRGEYDLAKQTYQRSLEFARAAANKNNIAVSLHRLGMIAQFEGNTKTAQEHFEECLETRKEIADDYGIAATLSNLGQIAFDEGNLSDAKRLYEESLGTYLTLGNEIEAAQLIWELGRLAEDQGDLVEARRRVEESLIVFRKYGDQKNIAGALNQLGRVYQEQGDMVGAQVCFEESLVISTKLNDELSVAGVLVSLSLLSTEQNNPNEAKGYFRAALTIYDKLKSPSAQFVRESLRSLEDESS